MIPRRPSPAPALIALVLAASAAFATEYKVQPDEGSRALADALQKIEPGDVILIEGDAIYPGGWTVTRGGAESNPVTLRGVSRNGKRPCIQGTNGIPQANVLSVRASNVVVENLEITAGDSKPLRGFYSTGDQVTLRNSVVHDVPAQGVHISDSAGSFTMTGVEVYRCGSRETAHQVYASSDLARFPDAVFRMEHCYLHDATGGNTVKSRARRTELISNWIEGAMYHELDLIGADPKAQHVSTSHDAVVTGNLLVKRPKSMGLFARLGTDGLGPSNGNYTFSHNTFVALNTKMPAPSTLFKLQGPITSFECNENLFWRTDNAPLKALAFSAIFPCPNVRISGSGNWITPRSAAVPSGWQGTRFLTTDPFSNPDVNRFTLTEDLVKGKPPGPIGLFTPPASLKPGTRRSDANPGAFPAVR